MRVLSLSIALALAVLVSLWWFGRARDAGASSVERAAQAESPAESASLDATGTALASDRAAVAEAPKVADAIVGPATPTTLAVGPRCRVRGRVTTEDSRPITDVELSLYSVGGPWSTIERLPAVERDGRSREMLSTKSGADGTFVFEAPLPTADWVALSATPSDYFTLGELNFGPAGGRNQPRLVEGDNEVGDLVLANCGAIRGRVRTVEGASAAGAVVGASSGPNARRYSSSVVDESGRFVLGHLAPGKTVFEVKKEGWVSSKDNPVEVRVGETVAVDDVVLARAAEISGIVVDQDGKPAAKVRLWGWPQESGSGAGATTRDDGTFTVYLPQTEPYSFEITRAKEFEPWGGRRGAADCTFEPGRKDVRIVLTRNAQLTFRVIDAEKLVPIEPFGIALDEKLPPNMTRSRFTRGFDVAEHPGGVATLPASASKHDVAVRAPGYAPFEGNIVLDPGSDDTATISLNRESSMRGRIVRAGVPMPNANVVVQRETLTKEGTPHEWLGASGTNIVNDVGDVAGRVRNTATGVDGTFVFGGMAPGTYALTVEASGVAKRAWRMVSVPKAGVADLGDLAMSAEATIRGHLLTPVGTSPIGYTVRLEGWGNPEVTIALADGSFQLTGLSAGTYVLNWNRPGEYGYTSIPRSPRAIDIVLAEGEVRDLTIDTAAFAPATVRTRVMRAGKPVAGLTIRGELHPPGDWSSRKFTKSSPKTDAEGWTQLEVEGGSHFDIVVVGSDEGPPLATVPNLDAIAGVTLERTIEIRSGSLTLELPESLSKPQPAWVLSVTLARQGHPSLHARAYATKPPNRFYGSDWTGPIVELGEFPADTYEATISFERPDENAPDPRRRRTVPIRDSYKTTITIEDGGTARLVVP